MECLQRYFCCFKPRKVVSSSKIVSIISTKPVLSIKPVTYYTNPQNKNKKGDIF